MLVEYGDPAPGVQLLLEGRAQALIVDGDRTEPAGRQEAPTWMAAISVLTGGPLGVRMQTETQCRVALIEPDDFRRLAFAQPAVHQRVMRQVAPVMSRITEREQNRERLASLGTMAAGLAHELNNPAAAAQSAARQLAEALDVVGSTIDSFVHSGVERAQAEQLVELHREALQAAEGRDEVEGLEASDAEEVLAERLEELGVPEPWNLVGPLAAAGVEREWLDRVAELAGPATGAAVAWLAATLTARGLVEELRESTSRMVDLVGAVKTYAYMDRGDLVEVDVHEGLKMTLKVLGHRLKHTEIKLEKDLDLDPSQADRARLRAQPGLDQPASTTRSTRSATAGRSRSPLAASATSPRSRSPTTAPGSRPRSATACSTRSSPPRTWERAPDSGWPPRTGSSWTATGARSPWSRRRAARPSSRGCRSARPEAGELQLGLDRLAELGARGGAEVDHPVDEEPRGARHAAAGAAAEVVVDRGPRDPRRRRSRSKRSRSSPIASAWRRRSSSLSSSWCSKSRSCISQKRPCAPAASAASAAAGARG